MIKAINDYQVEGVETTLDFGAFVMKHEAFRSGNYNTHFVKKHFSSEKLENEQKELAKIAALIGLYRYKEDQKKLRLPKVD